MFKHVLAFVRSRNALAMLVANALILLVFLSIYMSIDFDTHFTSTKHVTPLGKAYYGLMEHTGVGANDIVPNSDFARAVTASQVALAWGITLVLAAGK